MPEDMYETQVIQAVPSVHDVPMDQEKRDHATINERAFAAWVIGGLLILAAACCGIGTMFGAFMAKILVL